MEQDLYVIKKIIKKNNVLTIKIPPVAKSIHFFRRNPAKEEETYLDRKVISVVNRFSKI